MRVLFDRFDFPTLDLFEEVFNKYVPIISIIASIDEESKITLRNMVQSLSIRERSTFIWRFSENFLDLGVMLYEADVCQYIL